MVDAPKIPRHRGNNGGYSGNLLDVITAFDIETTNLEEEEQAIMYVWQWAFEWGQVVVGRTWEELDNFIARLVRMLDGSTLPVYVHNLSFEFQFLRTIYDFGPEEVFCLKSRKVLRASMYNTLELRCSYIHSNMSLGEYTKRMGVKHQKLDGNVFDYSKRRYPWTPLTDYELDYAAYDVIGLIEALEVEMDTDGDNCKTIPLTSTGYVRRDTKAAMKNGPIREVKEALPDVPLYKMLREAFRGGDTHANRYYAGRILHEVKSADRSSSYPDVICNCLFPVKPFIREGAISLDTVTEDTRYAWVLKLALYNVVLRDIHWGDPYISRDRCAIISDGQYDNGRVLRAAQLVTTVTDVDLRIISETYSYDAVILDSYKSAYGKLPKQLIDVNIDYYKRKTELKGVAGEEIYYMKSKNKLNSIYGMTAQDPGKQDIVFVDGEYVEKEDPLEEVLERYNKRAFLTYAWGVWVTAWARYRLYEGVKLAGDGFVYCDTDSVKYIGEVDWTAYNKQRISDSIANGAIATDPQGVDHYMGVYEQEGEAEEFKTLGAKKYVYRQKGKLTITVAGVGKIEGAKELERAGGVEAFKPGFVFRDAGGLDAVYNDTTPMGEIEAEGRTVRVGPNVYLRPSEYTVGITNEYEKILEEILKKG